MFYLAILYTPLRLKCIRVIVGIRLQVLTFAIDARLQFFDRNAVCFNPERHTQIFELCGQTAQ